MELVVIKTKNKIEVFENGKLIDIKDDFCYINGNIDNLDDLYSDNISNEEKVLNLYKKYGDDLFIKLDGDFSIILIVSNNIILVKDRMGSKCLYYTKTNDNFICSTSLKYIINNYKSTLKIDKQVLSNYLSYSYIKAPKTIFENVYKLEAGSYLSYNNVIKTHLYYDLILEYKKSKDELKKYEESEEKLHNILIETIKRKTINCNKVGVCFSSGVDSTLIAAICKKINKEVHTYTIGFVEKERDESIEARKMSKYLKTIHHEYFLQPSIAREIVNDLFKVYTEPFADPSMLPILFLNKKISCDMDIILTGDGADQLFLGSLVYDSFSFKQIPKNIIKYFRKYDIYNRYKLPVLKIIKIEPETYNDLPKLKLKRQIKYMLFDIQCFFSNRLFTKVGVPADYYEYNIAHPFASNDCVDVALKMKNKFKYNKGEKKYILKNILYKYINKEEFNNKKSGFGIPLKKWLKELYLEDIKKISNKDILEKQNLFDYKSINQMIIGIETDMISVSETYVIFSYYMFQLWYKEYIQDLWN